MRILILALALLLAAPVTASAAGGLKPVAPGTGLKPVPPSNSAANQYVEVVPTAGGGAPATGITRHTSSGSSSGAASALPAQTRTALAGSGQDGQRVAQLTQATAPARVRTHGKRTKHAGAAAPLGGSSGGGGSGAGSTAATPVSSVVKSLTGGGASGIGAGLPVALILVALGVSGVAVARRRAA